MGAESHQDGRGGAEVLRSKPIDKMTYDNQRCNHEQLQELQREQVQQQEQDDERMGVPP